jgi:hypothetical protein
MHASSSLIQDDGGLDPFLCPQTIPLHRLCHGRRGHGEAERASAFKSLAPSAFSWHGWPFGAAMAAHRLSFNQIGMVPMGLPTFGEKNERDLGQL